MTEVRIMIVRGPDDTTGVVREDQPWMAVCQDHLPCPHFGRPLEELVWAFGVTEADAVENLQKKIEDLLTEGKVQKLKFDTLLV